MCPSCQATPGGVHEPDCNMASLQQFFTRPDMQVINYKYPSISFASPISCFLRNLGRRIPVRIFQSTVRWRAPKRRKYPDSSPVLWDRKRGALPEVPAPFLLLASLGGRQGLLRLYGALFRTLDNCIRWGILFWDEGLGPRCIFHFFRFQDRGGEFIVDIFQLVFALLVILQFQLIWSCIYEFLEAVNELLAVFVKNLNFLIYSRLDNV